MEIQRRGIREVLGIGRADVQFVEEFGVVDLHQADGGSSVIIHAGSIQ